MQVLHQNKILHRDLKSSNILTVHNQKQVKICDFGLSTFQNHEKKKTREGLGTYNWMAPEVLRGEPYQTYSDVYSFGVVCWEILTQRIPLQDYSAHQIIGVVGYDQSQILKIESDSKKLQVIPLNELVEKCLQMDPFKRPSFEEIVNRL